MNLFLAAVYTNAYKPGQNRYIKLNEHEQNIVQNLPHILESYHYINSNKIVEQMRADNAKVFLDSGAFSAHTLGVTIPIEEYCEYIKRNMDILRIEDGVVMASVLDGIGDPLQTWRNQLVMEAYGAKPLPCFHFGEDSRYLDWYIERYDYITIGGMVGKSTDSLIKWLDRIWEKNLVDGSGNAKIKVHAFGITSVTIMERYPWHCMTEEDHKVLTYSGWKSLSEIKVGDFILCFDKGRSFWDQILELPTFEVSNVDIHVLTNRNFKAKVSSNHRWTTSTRYGTHWKFKTTEQLMSGSQQDLIPRVGEYTFPETSEYSEEFVELMGWFWTDGTIKKDSRYKNNSVVIYQSQSANPEKVNRIRSVLNKAKEKYCETKVIKKNGSVEISFQLYGHIRDQLLEISPDKHIPWYWIYELTKEQLRLFIEASVLADGCIGSLIKGDNFVLTQKSNKSIEQFQVACLLLGIPSNLSSKIDFNAVRTSSVKKIDPSQVWEKKEKYTGRLWCVRVASGAFFTKCEGKIYVTGNSCDSSSWIQSAAFGSIVSPDYGPLSVSTKSPSRHDFGRHVTTLSAPEKDHVLKMLEDQGFTLERLSTVYESRAAYNLWSYGIINAMVNAGKEKNKFIMAQELF